MYGYGYRYNLTKSLGSSFTCDDSDANAFISAHETATGQSMGDTQKSAVCDLVGMLKGTGTTNGSDLWTLMKSNSDSYLMPLCPIDDSTASADAYNVELLNASASFGTYFNFLAGDFGVLGVGGGTTKYWDSGKAQNLFGQDNNSLWVRSFNSITLKGGSIDGGANNATRGIRINSWAGNDKISVNNNTSILYTTPSNVGGTYLIGSNRRSSTDVQVYRDNSLFDTISATSLTPVGLTTYFHGNNFSGSLSAESERRLSLYAQIPSLTDNEALDFYEAINTFNNNVITGGR